MLLHFSVVIAKFSTEDVELRKKMNVRVKASISGQTKNVRLSNSRTKYINRSKCNDLNSSRWIKILIEAYFLTFKVSV